MNHRRTGRAIVIAAMALLMAGAVWAGRDWKQVPDPEARMLEKAFPVSDGARLRVNVSDVDVQLVQGDAASIRVEIYAQGRDRDKAREYFEKLNFTVEEKDNTVTVQTRQSSSFRVVVWNWGSHNVDVRAVITLPKGTDSHVRTSDGDIRAADLAGPLEARTSDGDIVMQSIEGPTAVLRTSDGDVQVDRITADEVEAKTSDGDVHIGSVSGKELTMSSSDGDVKVDDAKADEIYLKTSDGNIEVTASSKRLRAHTSDGDIDVTLAGESALDLTTSDGDISIHVPQSIGADVDLKGDNVHLSGGVNIEGDISEHHVRGSIGKGGAEISARSSDGSVTLERR